MRFLYGAFFGSLVATVLGTTICSAWFKPAVESYPEFKRVCEDKFHVEQERDQLRRQLIDLATKRELDALRRAQRDPVNPAGPVVPAEDRIPAPQVPFPLPVNPGNPKHKGEMNDEPKQEEGEGDEMAGTTATKSTALARSPGASLALNSVADLAQLSEMLYRGGLTPPGIDNPNKVAAVILAGLEVGLAPTQAIGSIMLQNGRLSIWGDGAMALVRASGLLESIEEWVDGEGESRTGHCKAKRKGESERHYTFTIREANQAGLIERAKGKGPWATYPDRMLIQRPRGFLFRDVFPDVLRGLITYEEATDVPGVSDGSIVNTEVRVTGVTARPVAAAAPVPTTPGPEVIIPAAESAGQPASIAPAAQSPALNQSPGSITDDQKEHFKGVHALVMAAKGVGIDLAARSAAWAETLKPYSVASIKEMSEETAARALAELGKQHDPFGHPAGKAGSSSQQPPGSSPQAA
jgi:hypothetical protein